MLSQVFKLSSSGTLTLVAGNGISGFSGDGGPATSAELDFPSGVAIDSSGNLFISDTINERVRRVDAATGIISTVAGNGSSGFSGDGGPATNAQLGDPYGLAVDGSGTLFIADAHNNRIRRVDSGTGVITTIAGNGTAGFSGDGGAAVNASLLEPYGVAIDSAGNLYVADYANNRVRRVDMATGTITTVAGGGSPTSGIGDSGPATSASLCGPWGVAVDSLGNFFIADQCDSRIRRVDATTSIITTVAGNGAFGFSGDGGLATNASLNFPGGVAVDSSGDLFIQDDTNQRIRSVSASTGIIHTVAGGGSGGDGGPAINAILLRPFGVAPDTSGSLFIADTDSNRIRRLEATTATITTVAGNGTPVYSGDGGPATSAGLTYPRGVAVDGAGNLFIADTQGYRIRRVDGVTGLITTVAGNGLQGYSGDGGPATSASLYSPVGLAVDSSGNLFIADQLSNRVRRIDAITGIITTVAGNGTYGYSGDGGPATSAELADPSGVAVDSSGNLYIADPNNYRIRRVDSTTGTITTIAGNGTPGYSGDGGPAIGASLTPSDVAVDSSGNLFIAGFARVRRVDAATGIITTVAGNGIAGFGGDGGPAASASLGGPIGVAVWGAAGLLIADAVNNRVRKVSLTGGVTLSATSLSFGDQIINTTSSAKTIIVTSAGGQPLTIASITPSGNFTQTNNCPVSPAELHPGSTCTITVNFKPVATGASSGAISISDNAPDTLQTVNLTGTGITSSGGMPAVSLSTSSLDFGSVSVGSTGSSKSITLTSSGTADLAISNIVPSLASFKESDDCPPSPATLAIGAKCTITVSFSPSNTGLQVGVLTLTDDAADSPQTVALSGTGVTTSPGWARSWGGSQDDTASAVTTDANGNVYVTGVTSSFGAGGQDVILLKYDSSGNLVWQKTWGGTGDEYGTAVAADSSGNLYVTGGTTSFGAGSDDVFLVKFDSSGNLLWSKTWGGSGYDVGHDISFDATGNLYVAAETYSFGTAAVLLKYDPNGNLVWTRTWKGPATYDSAYTLTVDSSGDVIEAGISWDYSVSPNHNTILLLKYDSSGNLLWNRNWTGPSEDEAWGTKAVQTDAAGNIYIAGREAAQCSSSDFSTCDFDFLVLKVDASGSEVWAKTWKPSTGWDGAGSLVFDSSGNLRVTGVIDAHGTTPAAALLTFDTSGNLLSSQAWTGTPPTGGAGTTVSGSTLLVAGSAVNNSGSWQALTGTAGSETGALSTPSGSVGSPTGSVSSPSGTVGSPSGILDTGGGGADVFVSSVSSPSQGPAVTFSPTGLPFGSVNVGTQSAARTVTVKNTGNANLTFVAGAVTLSGTNAADFSISADTCSGAILAPSSTCLVGVIFAPSGATSEAASLNLTDNAPNSPQAVGLTGTGITSGIPPGPSPTTVSLSASPASIPETSSSSSTLVATVLDQDGNPVSNTTVTFTTSLGGLSASSSQTDSSGQASVTLTPNVSSVSPENAHVAATAGGIQGTADVTFVPSASASGSWMTSSYFNVTQMTLPLSQYLSAPIYAYDGCIDLQLCPGASVDPTLLPAANIYLVTPVGMSATSAGDQADFNLGLSTFFGIDLCTSLGQSNCVPSGYSPIATVIVQVPLDAVANVLFNSNLQGSLGPWCLPGLSPKACIQTTAGGYVNLAFTISQTTNNGLLVSDSLQALGTALAELFKVTNPTANLLQLILDSGDVTVSVIKTDLSQSGPLTSSTFLDLSALSGALASATGYVGKDFSLLAASGDFIAAAGVALATSPTGIGAIAGSADAVYHLVQVVVTAIDIDVELIPLTIDPALASNTLYQWFEAGVNIVTTFVDPAGATIKPSFLDSNGNLVLGYDTATGTMIYAGPAGILFPDGDGYLALLGEDSSSPSNYSETLNAIAGTASVPVPYVVRILSYNRAQPFQAYGGVLLGGTTVNIPVIFNATDGSLVPQSSLKPTVSVLLNSGTYTIVAKALLNNGTSIAATNAYLIVNGQESAMTQVDSSTFDIAVNNTFTIPTPFSVYVISPKVPGGFASGILGPTTLAPAVSLSPTSVAFGSEDVGTTAAPSALTVTNSGNASLTFPSGAIKLSGANSADFSLNSDTCSSQSVAPNGTCSVSVTFKPSLGGNESATLNISDNAPGSPQTVSLAGTGEDFAIGASSGSSTSATVSPGQSASYSLSISPQGGFNQAVTLSCTGAPSHASCLVSPSSVTLDGSNLTTVSVTVSTTAGSLAVPHGPSSPVVPPVMIFVAALGMLALLGLRVTSRDQKSRLARLAPLGLLLLTLALWSSCGGGGGGGGSNSTPPSPGTPAGTYTLSISGNAGGLTHSTTVTLTVN